MLAFHHFIFHPSPIGCLLLHSDHILLIECHKIPCSFILHCILHYTSANAEAGLSVLSPP